MLGFIFRNIAEWKSNKHTHRGEKVAAEFYTGGRRINTFGKTKLPSRGVGTTEAEGTHDFVDCRKETEQQDGGRNHGARGTKKENYRDTLGERENTAKPGDNTIDRDKSEILPMHRKNGNAPSYPDKSGDTGERRDLCDDKRTYC